MNKWQLQCMYESFASDDEGAQQMVEDPCFPYEDEEELVKELTDSLNEGEQVERSNSALHMTAFEEMEARESEVFADDVAEALEEENKHLDKFADTVEMC